MSKKENGLWQLIRMQDGKVSWNRSLAGLCRHMAFWEKKNDTNKVERLVTKSAAAMLLASRIGDRFDAICTGAADKGT